MTALLDGREKNAVSYKDLRISYSRLIATANRYADLIPPGTKHVAVYSENRPEWIYALYGGWFAGASVVPVDFMCTPKDVRYIVDDCGPEVIFCSAANRPALDEALAGMGCVPVVFCFDELSLPEFDRPVAPFCPDRERPAFVIYTSGTTGGPKGVVLRFANLFANADAVAEKSGYYTSDRRVMALLPFHHILPLMGTLVVPLYVGASVALCPSLRPADMLETLAANRIDLMVAVPQFYSMLHRSMMEKINASGAARALFALAKKCDSKNLSRRLFKRVHKMFGGHLDVMVCGGAPLGKEIAEDFHALGFNLMEGYGMTETAPIISFPRLGHPRCGSVGQAIDCNEVRIVEGEILVRGGNVFSGYYNKPEETAEALRDGWLHTGDLGYIDEEGFLFITGRKKELIVTPNGKNISPDEVERKLMSFDGFLEETAVFMNDGLLHALIYPVREKRALSGEELDELIKTEVIAPYNAQVAPYKKILKYTVIHEEIPKTRLGKIKRFELKEMLVKEGRPEYRRPEPQTPEYREIKRFLEKQRTQEIGPDDHLEFDLGMDSLDRVSLLAYLQQTFGVHVDEEALGQHETVRKLSDFMRAMKNKFEIKALDWSAVVRERASTIHLPRSSRLHIPVNLSVKAVLKSAFHVCRAGAEELPDGPCIFAPNHQSSLDAFLVSIFLNPPQVKRTFFYAKSKHIRRWFMRGIARRFNVVVVDLETDVKGSIQALAEVLKQGKSVIIFPEGTRSVNGEIGSFKKTFAILSKELNVPVVPIAIDGAHRALPRGSRLPRLRQNISVQFLPPLYPNGMDYDQINDAVRGAIARQLSRFAS